MFSNKFGTHSNVECGLIREYKKLLISNNNSDPDSSDSSDSSESSDSDSDPDSETETIRAPVPLVSVNVAASVVHSIARVELTQVYVNLENEPIEAIYYFPVDSNGGVVHFQAELEGRTIKGIVKPEQEAKEQYKKALEQKQTAFLIEVNKPDIFKVNVGYLKSGVQVKIVIGYITEVKNEKGTNAIRFFVPTTVAPRYIPPTTEEDEAKTKDLASMKFSTETPAPLSISVNVALQGKIREIISPSHNIDIQPIAAVPGKENWNRYLVTLQGIYTDMDQDFVLLIMPDNVHVPRLYSEKMGNSTALMTHLIPSFELAEQKSELVFVLDRSGSMQGTSIKLAKAALTLFLHSLPVDCFFNVIGFGSSYKSLFSKSIKYNAESLAKAVSHAKKLAADLGGTEILEPLKAVMKNDAIDGYFRQVFVITDGEVSNTSAVISLCKNNAKTCRIFALGIGASASHHLVEGMAAAGGGTAIFVSSNEPMDAKILHQLKNATQPSLTNITLNWTGLPEIQQPPPPASVAKAQTNKTNSLVGHGKSSEPVNTTTPVATKLFTQVPRNFSPIFDGSQFVVFGLFTTNVPTGVEITADSPDGPLSLEIQVSAENDVGSDGMLHQLAAIKTIQELEMEDSGLKFGSNQIAKEDLKKKIVSISCQHGVVSKYTSFVAVDESNQVKAKDNWVMQSRKVPSQIPSGHQSGVGYSRTCGQRRRKASSSWVSAKRRCCSSSSMKKRSRSGGNTKYKSSSASQKRRCCRSKTRSTKQEPLVGCSSSSLKAKASKPADLSRDLLHKIVTNQEFDGQFALNQSFAAAIGKNLESLVAECKKNGWNQNVWATALALTYLKEKLSALQDSWELVESKGMKWLKNNFDANLKPVLDAAKGVLV